MSISAIATGIKTTLEAVENVGLVYDYQPVPQNDWSTFVNKFSVVDNGTRRINAWTVQYTGEQREKVGIGFGSTLGERGINFVIRGHYSWNDGTSDVAFRNLVEEVANALDAAESLQGTAIRSRLVDVILPGDASPIMLGDVMCHYVEIRLQAIAQVTLATA